MLRQEDIFLLGLGFMLLWMLVILLMAKPELFRLVAARILALICCRKIPTMHTLQTVDNEAAQPSLFTIPNIGKTLLSS
jgi:hypothetical protein